jgi:hypothetical protein
LRSWATYSSALGKTCPGCGRGVTVAHLTQSPCRGSLVRRHRTLSGHTRLPMALVSCWVLDLHLSVRHVYTLLTRFRRTARRETRRWFAARTLLQSAPTRDKGTRPSSPLLAALAECDESRGIMGTIQSFGAWLSMAGARLPYFLAPCPCGVVGSGAHGDCER